MAAGGVISLVISIHVLREEDDLSVMIEEIYKMGDFYPRPPRGGRQ